LTAHLRQAGMRADLVLGLPRGGVIVAKEVAAGLRLPLGVLVVRKIGHPWFREYAVGALAENAVVVLDKQALNSHPVPQAELDGVIEEEMERLAGYQQRFRSGWPELLAGLEVVLVDDGLATGATMEAAVQSARTRAAARVVVAVPVASLGAMRRISRVADAVFTPKVDPGFEAVGQYYRDFLQTTDEEVLAALESARIARTS
jgi:putative phosphoribosyl transferase